VLLDLADERLLALALDLDRVVDRGQAARRELDVDDRAGDLDDPAGRAFLLRGSLGGRGCLLCGAQLYWAPVAISIISRVMFAWRTLL
jgi:hypothetical protein